MALDNRYLKYLAKNHAAMNIQEESRYSPKSRPGKCLPSPRAQRQRSDTLISSDSSSPTSWVRSFIICLRKHPNSPNIIIIKLVYRNRQYKQAACFGASEHLKLHRPTDSHQIQLDRSLQKQFDYHFLLESSVHLSGWPPLTKDRETEASDHIESDQIQQHATRPSLVSAR